VQVRNPVGEDLTPEQRTTIVNRIESKLGLKDQPRAVALHTDQETGETHIHVAWSLIDESTLKARPLPFFKMRLKEACRELEFKLALTPVRSERDSEIKFAPTKAEEEQARRLGLNIHEIRDTIRACYDRSDCGRSFQAALADEGLTLAKGDQRDYLVIDEADGIHALGKKVLGTTAAQVRNKLADLDHAQLPTLDQAREQNLTRELSKVKHEIEVLRQPAPVWDRDAANRAWENAVIDAAIEGGNTGGGQREQSASAELARPAAHIREARQHSDNPRAFRAALAERGIDLAQATGADAVQSQLDSADAKIAGHWKPTFREGEIVAVTDQGQIWKLTPRTTGDKDQRDIQKFLGGLDMPLPSIQAAQHRRKRAQDIDDLKPRGRRASGPLRGGMVEHQAWAMDRLNAANEYRRGKEERRAEEAPRKNSAEVDPQRYLTDPDYRRQLRTERSYKTSEERKTEKENDLRALLEQQDRQR
jgi:hypothetical protein